MLRTQHMYGNRIHIMKCYASSINMEMFNHKLKIITTTTE